MYTIFGFATESELESLEKVMQIYQNNIDKNITWFYSLLAIVVAVLIVSLVIIVKASIKSGIEKGIEDAKKHYDQRFDEIKKGSIIESGENSNGDYCIWGNGRLEVTTKVRLRSESSNILSGQIVYPAAFSKIKHVNLVLININKSVVDSYIIKTKNETNSGLFVEVKGNYNTQFHKEDELFITVHAVGHF